MEPATRTHRHGALLRLTLAGFVLMGLSGCCCCVFPVAEETPRRYIASSPSSPDAPQAASLSAPVSGQAAR